MVGFSLECQTFYYMDRTCGAVVERASHTLKLNVYKHIRIHQRVIDYKRLQFSRPSLEHPPQCPTTHRGRHRTCTWQVCIITIKLLQRALHSAIGSGSDNHEARSWPRLCMVMVSSYNSKYHGRCEAVIWSKYRMVRYQYLGISWESYRASKASALGTVRKKKKLFNPTFRPMLV